MGGKADIVEQALKLISGEGEQAANAGIRAYHGSPHDFDKFSMDKIGTGEGAQAYGHGLYFAGNEDIARHYRQALSGAPTVQYKGDDYALPAALSELKEWRAANPEGSAYLEGLRKKAMEDAAKILLENVGGGSDAPGVLRNLVDSFPSAAKDTAKGWVEQAEKLIKPHLAVNEPGHMYEVNIAADPNTFLDWDKPLSEQPEAVRRAVGREAGENFNNATSEYNAAYDAYLGRPENPTPEELARLEGAVNDTYQRMVDARGNLNLTGAAAYRELAKDQPWEVATRKLREAGIPGIKYLDAGSRGAGDGTRNYVVFDDKLISIIRKYGIAGASAMLGYNLMENLDPKQALAATMADKEHKAGAVIDEGDDVNNALRVARDVGGATNENPQVFLTDAQGRQYDAQGNPIQPTVTQDNSNSSAQETKEPQRENINTMFNVAPKNYYSDVQPFLDYAMTPVDRPGMPSEPDLVDVMRIATQVAAEGQPTESRGEGNLARRREEFINNLYGVNPDQPNSPSANQAWIANRVVDFSPWALGEVAHDIPYEAGRTGDYGTAAIEGGINAALTTPVLGAAGRGIKKGYEYAKKFPLIPAAAAGVAGLTGGSEEAEAGKSDIVKKALRALAEEGGEAANAGIRAYQGSPHDFAAERLVRLPSGESQYIVGAPNVLPDLPEGAELIQDFPLGRMRMDKIGTGEGAQAYGHGLYAAEGEPVALDYRNALSEININGAPINKENPEHEAALNIWHYGNIENAKIENQQSLAKYETLWDNLSEKEKSKPENQGFFGTLINSLKSNLNLYGMHERGENILPAISSSGKVYEINIAANPETFIDWDKTLGEQSPYVRDILTNKLATKSEETAKELGHLNYKSNPNNFLDVSGHTFRPMNEAMSRELMELGIPGIKYLDAGSRGAGDGTRNYVVFDDKLISIIRKYGIAGASTMLGYNLMENLTPEQAKAASSADDFYQKTTNTKMDGGRVTGGNTYDNDPSVAHALALTSEY